MSSSKHIFLAVVFLAGLIMLPGAIQAAPPTQLSYHGILRDSDGTIVTDGSYTIRFALYTVASAGTPVWQETKSVTVEDGLFAAKLGTSTALSLSLFTSTLYLGLRVGSDSEMTPRTELLASPYALNATQLDGKTVGTGASQILALDASANLTLAGNLTTTGGLSLGNGLTVTAGTVTLPAQSIQNSYLADSAVTGLKIAAGTLGGRELGNTIALDGDMTFTLDGNDLVINDSGNGGEFNVELANAPVFTVSPAANQILIYESEIIGDTFTMASNTIENSAEITTEGTDFIIDLEDAGDFGLFELTADNITLNDQGRLTIDGAFSTGYGEWNTLGQILLSGTGAALDRTNAGGALTIGNFFATSLTIGRGGVTTTFPGPIDVSPDGIDTTNAVALSLGGTTATLISIAQSGVQTDINGSLRVNQTSDFIDDILAREDLEVQGSLEVGNGFDATIDRYGEHTNAIDFADTASGSCAVSGPLTWAGAELGEAVAVSSSASLTSGTFLTAHVTAVDAGVIQFCNLSGGNVDPASATYTTRFVR